MVSPFDTLQYILITYSILHTNIRYWQAVLSARVIREPVMLQIAMHILVQGQM